MNFCPNAATSISSVLNNTNNLSNEDDKNNPKDSMFTTSVAELRRKAQEHSAAIFQSLQQIQTETPEEVKNTEKVPIEEKSL